MLTDVGWGNNLGRYDAGRYTANVSQRKARVLQHVAKSRFVKLHGISPVENEIHIYIYITKGVGISHEYAPPFHN